MSTSASKRRTLPPIPAEALLACPAFDEGAEAIAILEEHALIARLDRRGKVLHASERFRAMTGDVEVDPDLKQSGPPTLFAPAWPTITQGHTWQGELTGNSRTGTAFWLQTSIQPVRNAAGQFLHYRVFATDVTPHKLAIRSLQRSVRWYRDMIESLPVAIYTTDEFGRITSSNAACAEFSGRTSRLGTDRWCVANLLTQSDGQQLDSEQFPMARALRDDQTVRVDGLLAERADGIRVNCLAHATPLHDETGRLIGGVGTLVDVTQSKRNEEWMRLLADALEQTEEPMAITEIRDVSSPARFVFVNAAYTRLTGFSPAEIIGQSTAVIYGPLTDRVRVTEGLKRLQAGQTDACETTVYRKDGSPFQIHLRRAPVRDATGRVKHVIGILQDVTERRAIEQELRKAREEALESARLKSRFLANMSHELRTPLNTINGVASTLLEQQLPDSLHQSIGLILQCGDALLGNIQTILTHSSLESGKVTLDASPFSPAEIVVNALRITGDKAQRKGLLIDYYIDANMPAQMVGDAFRLQQVLVNLLANAIKFTERGRVCLRLRSRRCMDGHYELRFTVADTGIGMTPESLERLFVPFSQVDDSSTRRYEGTGLGLVITKALVELMGGRIRVGSRCGQGSVFSFSVMLLPQAGSPTVSGAIPRAGLEGRRLLVIEDRPLRRQGLQQLAQAWGIEMVLARKAAEAVELARHHHFDLVLCSCLPDLPTQSVATFTIPMVWLCAPGVVVPVGAARSTSVADPYLPAELSSAFGKLLAPKSATPPVASTAGKLSQRIPLRILGADDVATNRDVLRFICRHHGYTIDLAENGVEVLRKLEKQSYDLVLLDINMPQLDGMATAREICRRYPDAEKRPRLVAVTANALTGDRERCLAAGMDSYLSKPLMPKNLAACIEILFGRGADAERNGQSIPAQAPLLNEEQLRAMVTGASEAEGNQMIAELLRAVRADYEHHYPRLVSACSSRRTEELKSLTHGLKGCVLAVGWTRMGSHLAAALAALRENRFTEWDSLPAEVSDLYKQSVAAADRAFPSEPTAP